MAAALLRPKFESKLDSDPGAAADEASAAVPAEIPPRVVDRVAAEVLGALKANAGALDSLLRRRLVGVWRRAAEGRVRCGLTLVTAYWDIPSKFSAEQYREWMQVVARTA